MRAGGLPPATHQGETGQTDMQTGPFNEGRGVTPGDAARSRATSWTPRTTFNEGRGVTPGDAGCRFSGWRTRATFNEGRGVTPGDAVACAASAVAVAARSMRAGGLPPATPAVAQRSAVGPPAFNEGRGVTPGDAGGDPGAASEGAERSMRAGGLPPATPRCPDIVRSHNRRSMRAGGLPPATRVGQSQRSGEAPGRSMRAGGLPPATPSSATRQMRASAPVQ